MIYRLSSRIIRSSAVYIEKRQSEANEILTHCHFNIKTANIK